MSTLLLMLAATSLAATEMRRIPAVEAGQGVAADVEMVYAVGSHDIGRYAKSDGRRLAQWKGDPKRFKHINSCEVDGVQLVCAASNYPSVPMTSQVLWFDARTLELQKVQDLGHGYGSLTWFVRHAGNWWACYANYDGKGGEPGRDHRQTTLVRLDRKLKEKGRWTFPEEVLARMAPKSSSGGSWGADGLLYVTGHDRPEAYVLRVPKQSGVLEYVRTFNMPTGGQAIAWDPADKRVLWSISREHSKLVANRVPAVR